MAHAYSWKHTGYHCPLVVCVGDVAPAHQPTFTPALSSQTVGAWPPQPSIEVSLPNLGRPVVLVLVLEVLAYHRSFCLDNCRIDGQSVRSSLPHKAAHSVQQT